MAQKNHDKLPEFFKNAILEKKSQAQIKHPNKKPAAFLDLDGTLIEGDISDGQRSGARPYMGLIDLALLGGYIAGYEGTEGMQKFWDKYERGFPSHDEAFRWGNSLIEKMHDENDKSASDFVKHHLSQLVNQYLFSFTRDLFEFFKSEDIIPIVISASPHHFVRQVHHSMPIEESNLFGMSETIPHNASGKEKRLLELCEKRPIYPLFAMGNKWNWDGQMIRRTCEEGGVGLLVNEGAPSNYTHSSLFYFNVV